MCFTCLCHPPLCFWVIVPPCVCFLPLHFFASLSVFASTLMAGRHSAMSWRQWSRISWRRGRRPPVCWLCSRSQTSWPPACLPCIPLHHKEAWRRSTWVSREENECVWLFDLGPAMSVLTMSNAAYAEVNFWTTSPVEFQLLRLHLIVIICKW